MAAGESNIIGDVTTTLIKLLGGESDISNESPAVIAATNGDPKELNLYLYQVLENPNAKNRNWVTQSNGRQQYPPLALSLYYLLTPYSTDAPSAQQALSHAVQRLYDNAIISGTDLSGSLRLAVEQLAIVLCPMGLEELTRIWNALQVPYRLSVSYEVRVVLIESAQTVEPSRVKVKHNVYQQH